MANFPLGPIPFDKDNPLQRRTPNGLVRVFIGTDGLLYRRDEEGVDHLIGSGGGGGTSWEPIAGTGITITPSGLDYIFSVSENISAGPTSGIQGRFQLNPVDITYTISHPTINPSAEFPVATLEVSSASSDLHILGIHDRTPTSFKVTISGFADSSTYLLWHISTQSATASTTLSSSGGSILVSQYGNNFNLEVATIPPQNFADLSDVDVSGVVNGQTIKYLDGTWVASPDITGAAAATWGGIIGNLSDQLDLQTALNAKVSKTGDTMTGTLTMSGAGIQLDRTYIPPWQEGRVFYDEVNHTLAYYNDNNEVTINVGQEHVVRVRNSTGSVIDNGKVVVIQGSTGNHPNVVLASNNSANAHDTIGVATHHLGINEDGYITVKGLVNGLNTDSFSAEGVTLWLGTNGNITETEPTAPTHKVKIGYLIRKHVNQGRILVAIDTGNDLKDLHDVNVSSVANRDLISYSTTNGRWENLSVVAATSGALDSRYTLLTTTESISADLQSQINTKQGEITIVAGNNISISESPADTWTISANISGSSSLLQGMVACDTVNSNYTISHTSIDLNYSFPVVSLVVPVSGSNLFVQGITNRTSSSFQVTLSEVPNVSGYYISWHLPTTNASLDGIPVINLAISNIPSYTTSVSGSYSVTLSESIIYADNDNIIVLPASPTTNESHWIVNTYTSDILIDGNGKIISVDGVNNPTLSLTTDSSLHIHFNTTKNKWYVI